MPRDPRQEAGLPPLDAVRAPTHPSNLYLMHHLPDALDRIADTDDNDALLAALGALISALAEVIVESN